MNSARNSARLLYGNKANCFMAQNRKTGHRFQHKRPSGFLAKAKTNLFNEASDVTEQTHMEEIHEVMVSYQAYEKVDSC